jgi:multiple sugar transport system substrate-binding protein
MGPAQPLRRAGCLVLAVALGCSCTGGEPGPARARDLETVDPTGQTIVYWYQHTREREDALLELIAEFNRTNAFRISVRGEYAGGYDDIYNKMIVGLQGGSVPDLLVAYQNQARAYYTAGGVVDLDPYVNSPRWGLSAASRADLYEAFVQQDRAAGAQICFPPNRSVEVLFCNLDWLSELGFDHPPRRWDEFAEMCRAASRQPFSRSADRTRSLGFLLEIDASRMASLVFGQGGNFLSASGEAYTLDTPQMRAALGLILELMREGCVQVLGEEYGDQREFSVGQVLFVLRSSSSLPFVDSAVRQGGVGFAWDVAALPSVGDAPVVNVYGASLAVPCTTEERQLAAWLFVKWLTEPPQQARWVRASNYFPVRRSTAAELAEYFSQNPRYESVYKLLEYGRSEPSLEGYQQVRRMIEDAMVGILDGDDMDRTLAALQRRADGTLVAGR